MQDKELYEKLLGLKSPWRVSDVDLRMDESKVTVKLAHELLARFPCPDCGVRRTIIGLDSGGTSIPVGLSPWLKLMFPELTVRFMAFAKPKFLGRNREADSRPCSRPW